MFARRPARRPDGRPRRSAVVVTSPPAVAVARMWPPMWDDVWRLTRNHTYAKSMRRVCDADESTRICCGLTRHSVMRTSIIMSSSCAIVGLLSPPAPASVKHLKLKCRAPVLHEDRCAKSSELLEHKDAWDELRTRRSPLPQPVFPQNSLERAPYALPLPKECV